MTVIPVHSTATCNSLAYVSSRHI